MKHENFRVTYDGSALVAHEIDVRVLAPALLAVGDVLEHANRVINNGAAKVAVNVKGSLKTGSVNIDFAVVQGFISQAIDLLSGKEVTAAATLLTLLGFSAKDGIKGALQVLKELRGRQVKKVEISGRSATVYVEDDIFEIESEVLELIRDYELRKSFEAMLEPLEKDGVDLFAVGTDTKVHETVTKSQVAWFHSPPPSRS